MTLDAPVLCAVDSRLRRDVISTPPWLQCLRDMQLDRRWIRMWAMTEQSAVPAASGMHMS